MGRKKNHHNILPDDPSYPSSVRGLTFAEQSIWNGLTKNITPLHPLMDREPDCPKPPARPYPLARNRERRDAKKSHFLSGTGSTAKLDRIDFARALEEHAYARHKASIKGRKQPYHQNHQSHQNHQNHQSYSVNDGVTRGLPRKQKEKTRKGRWVIPDLIVDLHGYTLAQAYQAMHIMMERAIQNGQKILLIVTGKSDQHNRVTGEGRGAIRAQIIDWIDASPYNGDILSIRPAERRHGGAGAFYIFMK